MSGQAEYQPRVLLAERLSGAGRDLAKVRGVDEWKGQADQSGASTCQSASIAVGGVALLADVLQDGFACGRGDIRASVENPRNSCHRDTGAGRDVADRRS